MAGTIDRAKWFLVISLGEMAKLRLKTNHRQMCAYRHLWKRSAKGPKMSGHIRKRCEMGNQSTIHSGLRQSQIVLLICWLDRLIEGSS